MNKTLIGGIVAGVLIMAWQTLSHTALNLHASQEQYTPNEAAILKALSDNLTADGQYFLPGMPPGSSAEDMEKKMTESMGRPYASILYHQTMDYSMTSNLIRGLATNILLGILLAWLLGKMNISAMGSILMASLVIGFISFSFYPYPGFIWYQMPGIWTELIDALAAFGLAGLWLGWWLPRKRTSH